MKRAEKSKLSKPAKKSTAVHKYEMSDDHSTFAQKLKYYIDLSGEKPSDIYRRAWLPRRTYSRIMNGNYSPGKDAAVSLCLALKLNVQQSVDLLSRNSMILA